MRLSGTTRTPHRVPSHPWVSMATATKIYGAPAWHDESRRVPLLACQQCEAVPDNHCWTSQQWHPFDSRSVAAGRRDLVTPAELEIASPGVGSLGPRWRQRGLRRHGQELGRQRRDVVHGRRPRLGPREQLAAAALEACRTSATGLEGAQGTSLARHLTPVTRLARAAAPVEHGRRHRRGLRRRNLSDATSHAATSGPCVVVLGRRRRLPGDGLRGLGSLSSLLSEGLGRLLAERRRNTLHERAARSTPGRAADGGRR